jgi:hypothetical protein
MPYKDKKRQFVYITKWNKAKREKTRTRLKYLELEVQRLNRCLEVALSK